MKTQLLLINRINYLIRKKIISLNPALKDLKTSEYNFLLFLYKSSDYEMSLKLLESELQQSQSGINEISLRLESLGYIVRFKDPEDKRRLKAKLTEDGIKFANARDYEAFEDENLLLEGVSEDDKETYLRVAYKIYQNSEKLLQKQLNQ